MRRHGSSAHYFPVSVGANVCANVETVEFWLELDGQRVGQPVFMNPEGRRWIDCATIALKTILERVSS